MTSTPRYHTLEWTEERAAHYWEWQAQFPEQYFTNLFGRLIARRLRRLLGGRRSVLDYGCGVGFLVPHLAALGLSVTATDASPAAVAATNARNRGIANFAGAEPLDALLASGRRFDAIVSIEVIEHVSDSDLDGFLDSLRRLLAPAGVAIVTTPNAENLKAAQIYCPCCNHVFHRWQHMRSWTAATLGAALAGHGFVVEHAFATDFAYQPLRDLCGAGRRLAKRLLGRPIPAPHLVCVARAAE